jgi:hypothetical protein
MMFLHHLVKILTGLSNATIGVNNQTWHQGDGYEGRVEER